MKSLIKALALSLFITFTMVLCFLLGWYTNPFLNTFWLDMGRIDHSRALRNLKYSTAPSTTAYYRLPMVKLAIELLMTSDTVRVTTHGDAGFPEIYLSEKHLVFYNIISSPTFVQMEFLNKNGMQGGGYRLFRRQSNIWLFTTYKYRTDRLLDRTYDNTDRTVRYNKGGLTNEEFLLCIQMHPTNYYNLHFNNLSEY